MCYEQLMLTISAITISPIIVLSYLAIVQTASAGNFMLFPPSPSRCVLRGLHGPPDAQPDQVYTGGKAAPPQ